MSAAEVSERLWERAFQLSYFILMDRSAARECVARAIEKLAAQRSREKRRTYWRGRKKQLTIRRISRPTEDTLQWLVCLESEVCEKEQELLGQPTEADMVVRYVKHLAQMSTGNSSFHVNIGFNRLLRNYTTPEVQQIYELATGRFPASEEYRKAKGKLLNQLAALEQAPAHAAQLVGRYAFKSDASNLRGTGSPGEPVVSFTSGESMVILELPVANDEHALYRVTLSSFPQEQERLSETALRPVKSGNHWIVEFALPAALVEGDTHYLLTLAQMSGADSGRYLFEVRKK